MFYGYSDTDLCSVKVGEDPPGRQLNVHPMLPASEVHSEAEQRLAPVGGGGEGGAGWGVVIDQRGQAVEASQLDRGHMRGQDRSQRGQ